MTHEKWNEMCGKGHLVGEMTGDNICDYYITFYSDLLVV